MTRPPEVGEFILPPATPKGCKGTCLAFYPFGSWERTYDGRSLPLESPKGTEAGSATGSKLS